MKDKKRQRVILIVGIIMASLIIPIAIDCAYKAGLVQVYWRTNYFADDILIYAGGVLAFMGTLFLGLLALHQNDKMHEREARRDEDITKRETYAYLEPKIVFAFHQTTNLNSALVLKEQIAPNFHNEFVDLGWGFQFKMKSSREMMVIAKAKIFHLQFTVGGRSFCSEASLKTTPVEIDVETHIYSNETSVDHLMTFMVKLLSKSPLELPDAIQDIRLEISYVNMFGVEVKCLHVFGLNKKIESKDTTKENTNEFFVSKMYLPNPDKLSTFIKPEKVCAKQTLKI